LIVVAAVFLLSGCGGGMVPAGGTLTLKNGTPLTRGILEFYPEKTGEDVPHPTANVAEGGKYTIWTVYEGDGCAPGKYKVVILDAEPPIHSKYTQEDTTDLTAEIKADKTTFDFQLDGPG
jgi:hypothetical protein